VNLEITLAVTGLSKMQLSNMGLSKMRVKRGTISGVICREAVCDGVAALSGALGYTLPRDTAFPRSLENLRPSPTCPHQHAFTATRLHAHAFIYML